MKILLRSMGLLIFLVLSILQLGAQIDSSTGHFLYKPEKFSPPVQAMIKQFEGFPSTPLEAPDIQGKKHRIGGYQGKVTLLFFWRSVPGEGDFLFDQMSAISEKYPKKVKVLSFADESQTEVRNFIKSHPVKFPVIANSKMLSEAVYGSELGYPRIFVIDEFGIIKLVLPQVVLSDGINLEEMLTLFF